MEKHADCKYKKNEIIRLTIDDMGNDGEGIGKSDGFTFFVKDAVPGDVILARVLKLKKNYGFARVEEIVSASLDRVTPRCPVARQCGGCQLQHISYERQLAYKNDKVKNCLERIGGLEDAGLEPIIGMDEPYYYRNKAQYPVGMGKDGTPVIGFYAGRTHSIVDTKECYIQAPVNAVLVAAVREYLTECNVAPYNEETHGGLVRHILTRVGFTTGEIMVCMILNGDKLPGAEVLKGKLERAIETWNRTKRDTVTYRLASLCINVNTEKTNVILGKQVIPLFGDTYITDYIGSVKYRISPLSFYQVNPGQTRRLYEQALAYADLKGGETVWDLYCGIGTISLFLAQKAGKVYGVEIVPQAIEDARKNAELNGITNAEFFVGAAEDVLPEKYRQSGGEMAADVIVVDPPRAGCAESLLATIVAMHPEKVVYVSCDPATLARDVRYLTENGYQYIKGRAVDQFGQSGHVETVVKLSLKKGTPKIEVTMEPDEESNYTPEEKATYQKIKDYVKDKYGVNVHTSYIAQVKRMCGLDMGENYNKSKKENPEVKQCPQEKVGYIKDALKFYKII